MKRVRIAPSPTGSIHWGTLFIFTINFLYGDELILRIDDTDKERSKEIYVNEIKELLQYLNIKPYKTIRQSDRTLIYDKYFNELKKNNFVYDCHESEEEIQNILTIKKNNKQAPKFTKKDRIYNNGNYWRFEIPDYITLFDTITNTEKTYKNTWSDPIIKKSNGDYTYNFVSVVDDIEENITDILRGFDHKDNTIIHKAIGDKILGKSWDINFYYLSLLCDQEGKKLSKRSGNNCNILDYEPLTLFNIFFNEFQTLEELRTNFRISIFKKPQIKINLNRLNKINKKILSLDNNPWVRLLAYNVNLRKEIPIQKNILHPKIFQENLTKEDMIDIYNYYFDKPYGPNIEELQNYFKLYHDKKN